MPARDPRLDPQPGDSPTIICDTCKWAFVNDLYEPDCLGHHNPNSDRRCRFYASRNKAEVVKEAPDA